MADFRKLVVWRKAHEMVLNVHHSAARIRRREDAPLRTQIIRAAMSVPANIVEGRAQQSDKEFARFVRIAFASAAELEYHLMLAGDLGAVSKTELEPLLRQVVDVKKMLSGLLNQLKTKKPLAATNPGNGKAEADSR